MRITIETEGREESVSVRRDGQTQASEFPEAIDGGAPPPELVELLTGAPAAEGPDVASAKAGVPGDAGAVPAWLVDVIEGMNPNAPDVSAET